MISAADGYQEDRPKADGGVVESEQLNWHRIRLGATGPRSRARSYWEFFWRGLVTSAKEFKPDLVFTSSPPLTQVLLALLASTRWRVPLVLEIRDLWPFFLEEMGLIRSRPALAALRGLEWLSYRSASAIVSASPAFRPYLEACGIAPSALVDAPHGARRIDLSVLHAAGRAFREVHGLGERPVILFAGSLQEYYAVETWLAAAARLARERPEAVLVVAGGGRERSRIEAAARTSPSILYLGSVARNELDGAIGAADIGLVCLSTVRGFEFVLPGKLVDLLSCAVPVVTTVPGQATKLVQIAEAGWVARDDPIDLTAVLKLAIDAGHLERRRRGTSGRSFILKQLSAQAQATAIADVCDSVLAVRVPMRANLKHPVFGPARAADLLRAGRSELASAVFEDWLQRQPDPDCLISGHEPRSSM